MKWKHKEEIKKKFFEYELNARNLEYYRYHKRYRFFNINRAAMILFLFSRNPINRKSLEDIITHSVLVYAIFYNNELRINQQIPALIINIGFSGDSLNFYYNCPYTIKTLHNLG